MGCAMCRKQELPDIAINRANQAGTGYKDLFYATNEFDLSRSESEAEDEDEEENNSPHSLKNKEQPVTKQPIAVSKEHNSTDNNTSTGVVNNQIFQIGV